MPINPSIALGIQPIQLNDPLQAYSNALRVQGARAEFDAARQARADQNALRQAYRDSYGPEGLNQNALLQTVAERGLGDQIPGLIDTFSKQKTAELNRLKTVAELQKGAATFVMANPQFARQALMRFGAQTGEDVTQQLAELDSLGGDPEAIRRWAAGHAASADQLLPKTETRDFGGYIGTTAIDPLTGRPGAPTKVADKTFAPGEQQRIATDVQRANLEAQRLQFEKDKFARGGADGSGGAPSLTEVVDPSNPKQMLRVNAKVYQGGGLGSPGVIGISGKEPVSAAKENQTTEGRSQVDTQIATLKDLYDQLLEGGGITSTSQGPGANVAAGAASSTVGQATGRLFGTQNQSNRNKIAQMRPLLLQAIKQATGMSAKQMDSNVELKMYLAAATDPTLDYEANVAALENLSKLFGEGGAAPATPKTSAPAGGVDAKNPLLQ